MKCLRILVYLFAVANCARPFPMSDQQSQQELGMILLWNAFPATFTPASIGGLRLWLQAESLTQASGSSVSSWPDLSGMANTVQQATPASQPLLMAGQINGKPVVRFDGVNDFMLKTSQQGMNNAPDCSFFSVFKRSTLSAGVNRQIIMIGPNTNNTGRAFGFDFTDHFIFGKVGTGSAVTSATTFGTANFSLVSMTNTAAGTATVFLNGTQDASGTLALTFVSPDLAIGSNPDGATSFQGMDLAEVLFYDSALPSTALSRIECYLASRYGITPAHSCQ